MIYWDSTKAATPPRNQNRDAQIQTTADTRAYRRAAIDGMRQSQAAQVQRAYEQWKREKGIK